MSKKQMLIKPLTQVSPTDVSMAESELNALGKHGLELLSVVTSGKNNRCAHATGLCTRQKWEYKILHFAINDPKRAQETLNKWGEDEWEFTCSYGQGTASWSTVAVMKRPVFTKSGSVVLADPFPDTDNAAQTPDPLEADRQDPPRSDNGTQDVIPATLESALV